MERFRFGLPAALKRVPIWHQMKTNSFKSILTFKPERFHAKKNSVPFSYEKV